MRLAAFTIRNFKSIREATVTVPKTDEARSGSADFLSLIGENNVGKSSIMEALLYAFPGGKSKPSVDHFHSRDAANPIQIELTFDDITPEEQERHGIRGHVHGGRYRIRKTWTSPNQASPAVEAFAPNITVPGLEEAVGKDRDALAALSPEWKAAIEQFEADVGPLGKKKLTKTTVAALDEHVRTHHPALVNEGAPEWSANPGGIRANPDSCLPVVIYVPAVKEVGAEANPSAKGSAAQDIFQRLFEQALAQHDKMKAFRAAAEGVRDLFHNVEGEPAVLALQNDLTARMRRLIDVGVEIDFEPPNVTSDLTKSTVFQVVDGDLRTSPNHQGHGAQRALILTLLEVYAEQLRKLQKEGENPHDRGLLLLIEEPEIYLHPQMCRRMRNVLVKIARSGTGQVICTSHSPVFLDLADRHDGIVLLRRSAGGLKVLQRSQDLFEGEGADDARRRLRMLLDFDPGVCEVFFASRVCLVEGDTEVAAMHALARRLVKDGSANREKVGERMHRTTVVNCIGKWTIAAIQRVLNGFEIPYVVVHDADNEGDGGANARILGLLGDVPGRRLRHEPNFEQAIWGEEWNGDKPWKATQKITGEELPEPLMAFFTFVLGCGLDELV